MAHEKQSKNHWMGRGTYNENRRQVRNVAAYNAAHELALIKEKIKKLLSEEKKLKETLTNLLALGDYIELEDHQELGFDYIVEFIKVRPRGGLIPSKTLRYIEKRFGTKASLGVMENCSFSKSPIEAVYVRPFPKNEGKSSISTSSDDLFWDNDTPF